MEKPNIKPKNPNFSSGPCSKRPGWNFDVLKNAPIGRSHRHKVCKEKLNEVIVKSKISELIEVGPFGVPQKILSINDFPENSEEAEIASSSVGNYTNKDKPEFEDFGEVQTYLMFHHLMSVIAACDVPLLSGTLHDVILPQSP